MVHSVLVPEPCDWACSETLQMSKAVKFVVKVADVLFSWCVLWHFSRTWNRSRRNWIVVALSLVLQGSFATHFSCNLIKCEKRHAPPDLTYNCPLYFHSIKVSQVTFFTQPAVVFSMGGFHGTYLAYHFSVHNTLNSALEMGIWMTK